MPTYDSEENLETLVDNPIVVALYEFEGRSGILWKKMSFSILFRIFHANNLTLIERELTFHRDDEIAVFNVPRYTYCKILFENTDQPAWYRYLFFNIHIWNENAHNT
jgi:hypothetical protein